MAKPAGHVAANAAKERTHYEQPLSERMRTFLRLEFLYQQLLYTVDDESDWATRATVGTLLEILAMLSRGDVRSEVHKELDLQISQLQRYRELPGVDTKRLDKLLKTLVDNRSDVAAIGTQFLQPLKDSEFLSAIKHRSSIPGGTCEFDLPEYSHWLRQPYSRRQRDVERWIGAVRPLCDAVSEVLWLIREVAKPTEQIAVNGMFQYNMQKADSCRLLRVSLASGTALFPEISGSQHRFTIRFLEWSTIGRRAVQTSHDVRFELSVA